VDQSLSIARQLVKAHSEVQLFQHPDQQNRGAGASRNLGLRKAQMPYVAFLDADDFYLPQRFVFTQKQFQQYPDAGGVYEAIGTQYATPALQTTFLQTVRGQALTTLRVAPAPKQLFEILLLGQQGWCHLNGFTLKRKVLSQLDEFDSALQQSQDLDFILSASLKTKLYPGHLTQPVAMRFIHDNNRILDRPQALYYKQLLYQKWFSRISQHQWSSQVNRFLFSIHLSYHPWVRAAPSKYSRRWRKSIMGLRLLLQAPWRWHKLL
ncbi:MAG: glycosyltransferase, partial [Bacteroidota bacterium]